jgi:coenzyme F420-reducing hydrogenase gamma subunit
MEYLGIQRERIKLGVFDFTGCEGCELQIANKEETLAAFLDCIEVVKFREVSSAAGDDYDVALVDGAITRDDESDRLKEIRARAKVLVAIGSCACFGGVNRMKNATNLSEANRVVYGNKPKPTLKTRAVHELVRVDLAIPGCPINKEELERVVRHVVLDVPFEFPVYPVCVECKHRFTTCLFEKGQLCLGTIVQAGCNAPCPAGGLGCWGCRGPAQDHNMEEFLRLARQHGFSDREVAERLGFFGGFEVPK